MTTIKDFISKYFQHFNSRELKQASEAWVDLLDNKGKMFLTLSGAMSTAGLGKIVAELIEADKIHAICCTGANLEEDVYRLISYSSYSQLPKYRRNNVEVEQNLLKQSLNRVTDVAIPEEAMLKVDKELLKVWKYAEGLSRRYFPHEYFFEIFAQNLLGTQVLSVEHLKTSWVYSAFKNNIPIYVPGWEDSTSGNSFVSEVKMGNLFHYDTVKSGIEYMAHLVDWYRETSLNHKIGFFQIGGGIAGDFPICVVPLISQDMKEPVRLWEYFCQIGDGQESYGSYSQARPEEKITWGKLDPTTPMFDIKSDATIVFPLMAKYVLETS